MSASDPITLGKQGHQPRRARIVAAIAALLFCVLGIEAARLGVSGLLLEWALPEQASSVPSPAIASLALERLTTSVSFAPSNPWALERLGAVELALIPTYRSAAQASARTQDALARFRRAIEQRPASGYLWAQLALAKLYLGTEDTEMMRAMEHAQELAPKEPIVQQTLLYVGLGMWDRLPVNIRQARLDWIDSSATREPRTVLDLLKHFNRLELACRRESYNGHAGTECRAIGPSNQTRSQP